MAEINRRELFRVLASGLAPVSLCSRVHPVHEPLTVHIHIHEPRWTNADIARLVETAIIERLRLTRIKPQEPR